MKESPFSKKKQLAYKEKRKNPKVTISEDALQKQCNDVLEAYRIRYLRLPDWLWLWLKKNAPMNILNYMSKVFTGMPDNIAILPLNDKYNLALCLELKTEKGQQHGKQKHWSKELKVQLSRNPDETIAIIESFLEDAEKLKELLSRIPQ
jgi:hypothetical protein